MNKKRSLTLGFTLIEMTIVIVIASVLVAAGLALLRPYFAQQQIERTASAVRTVERALDDFLAENGRYPCPAPLRTPRSDAADGVELCAEDLARGVFAADGLAYQGSIPASSVTDGVFIGAVPYRTLDIPVGATLDAVSNRLTYVVSAASASVATFDDGLGGDVAPYDLNSSAAVLIVNESGTSISQRDINGIAGDEPLSKHYYFFSHGSDGAGAYSDAGIANAAVCGNVTLDSENCDMDGRFVAAARSLGTAAQYNDDVSNETLLIEQDLNDSLWARNPTNDDHIYNLNDENVGIGTGPGSLPETKLHIKGDGPTAQLIVERSDKKLVFDPNSDDNDVWAQIAFDTGMGFQFVRHDGSNIWTSLVNITNAGNVGIGIEAPEEQLHILGDFVQDLSPAGPSRYTAATAGDGSGRWTHLGVMDNGAGASGVNNDTNQYGFRVNWDSDQLVIGLEDNGPNRKDGVIGLRTGELDQDALHFEIDGVKGMSLKTDLDDVPYADGSNPVVGHLGVGLNNPSRILDVNRNIRIRSAGANWWTSLDIWHNTDTVGHNPAVTMYRGRGSHEVPAGAQIGDVMGVFDVRGTPSIILPPPGYGSGMVMRATENHTAGRMGTDLNLMAVQRGYPTARSRVRILDTGVVIGGDEDGDGELDSMLDQVPRAKLDVRGEVKIGRSNPDVECSAANPTAEGSQRYNAVSKRMEFCNGTAWLPMGGGGGNVEYYDCVNSGYISDGGFMCSNPQYVVKQVYSNGGDWGGGDYVTCCKARVVP